MATGRAQCIAPLLVDGEDGVAVGGDGGAVVGDDDDCRVGAAFGEAAHQGFGGFDV